MAIDPVCGMEVDAEHARAESWRGGQHYLFCSSGCRDRFEANPDQYLSKAAAATDDGMEKHEPPFTNKGFTAPKFGSAGSGGAEFERLPEQHDEK